MQTHPNSFLWSSEYVSPGHPDKFADQISDAVLDAYLAADPHAKVACETMVKGNHVFLAGEISANAHVSTAEIDALVRATIRDIGYAGIPHEFDADSCEIHHYIAEQSREINKAVGGNGISGNDTTDRSVAAGDQGIMFGYATRETPTHMPMAIYLAKAFIMEAYERLRAFLHTRLLPAVVNSQPDHIRALFTNDTKYLINPAGTWNVGGPVSDCGLTGRKIVVDQYGADCEIGGLPFANSTSTTSRRQGS